MPNQNRTLIVIVLDRSGSMDVIRDETISSVNRFVDEQRRQPGHLNITLVQFSTDYVFMHKNAPAGLVDALTLSTYRPHGHTALLDAVGRAVDETGFALAAMPEAERPSKVITVIVTDGQENASREYTWKQVRGMITHQREKYGWQFVFLGAGIDGDEAAAAGIGRAQFMSFSPSPQGVRNTYAVVSSNVSSYRNGDASSVSFDDSDRAAAVDTGEKDGTP